MKQVLQNVDSPVQRWQERDWPKNQVRKFKFVQRELWANFWSGEMCWLGTREQCWKRDTAIPRRASSLLCQSCFGHRKSSPKKVIIVSLKTKNIHLIKDVMWFGLKQKERTGHFLYFTIWPTSNLLKLSLLWFWGQCM